MLQFNAVFGVSPGYYNALDWIVPANPLLVVEGAWRKAMEIERRDSGIIVTAVLHASIATYPETMGCPPGGETTITAIGTMHPHTGKSRDEWRQAVCRIVGAVREALDQQTAMISFHDVDVVYLTKPPTDVDRPTPP